MEPFVVRVWSSLVVVAAFFAFDRAALAGTPPLETGDVVFQASSTPQSAAIKLATHSSYSHVGMVYAHGGQLDVVEAVDPVKVTPLADWIARGEGGHFVAKRLKGA